MSSEKSSVSREERKAVPVPTAITRYQFYHDRAYTIDPSVGLIYHGTQVISNQRSLAFTLVKKAGSNLFKGKSVLDVSLPISVFEPCTSLERLARLCQYCPAMISPLPQIPDPLERMKRLMAWTIASMHIGISQAKPFDSMVGETMQATVGDLEFYAEQRKANTPTMYLIGKDFCMYGDHTIIPHTYPNSAKVVTDGIKTIILYGPNHSIYTVNNPEVLISGIMVGTRLFKFQGDLVFEDKVNKLYGHIRLNPNAKGFFSGIFSKSNQREDSFKGFITNNKELLKNVKDSTYKSKDILSICEGNWIEHMIFDGKDYWDIELYSLTPVIIRSNHLLPSDSSLRPDVDALKKGNAIESQKLKEQLENSAKQDQKLRDSAKSSTPSMKKKK